MGEEEKCDEKKPVQSEISLLAKALRNGLLGIEHAIIIAGVLICLGNMLGGCYSR